MPRSTMALAAVLALLALPLFAAGAPPTYAQVSVAPAVLASEPSVVVDASVSPARVYVASFESSAVLWTSTDGGATFGRSVATGQGGGDADVAVDADGTVYVVDLASAANALDSAMPVSTSLNHGRTFARTVDLAPGSSSYDRQWMAASGHGHVVVTAHAGGLFAWVSEDAAQTFSGPFTMVPSASFAGRIVQAPDGSLLEPFFTGADLQVARSVDGGYTWSAFHAADTPGTTLLFPALAVDDAGDLYVAWSMQTSTGETVFFARSLDGGASWSAPVPVSDPSPGPAGVGSPSAVFPWIVAGASGKVAVVWYQAREAAGGSDVDLGADYDLATTQWDLMAATSLDAGATWGVEVAAPDVHTGSICTQGLSCVGPQGFGVVNAPTPNDRRMGDFFQAALDPTGHLLAAYPKDRPATTGMALDAAEPRSDITLATQVDGPALR